MTPGIARLIRILAERLVEEAYDGARAEAGGESPSPQEVEAENDEHAGAALGIDIPVP